MKSSEYIINKYEKSLLCYERQKEVTVKQSIRMVKGWASFLESNGKDTLAGIEETDISRYINKRRGDDLKDRSIKRELSVIGDFYSYLVIHSIVPSNPFEYMPKLIGKAPKEAEYLTPPEVKKLMAVCDRSKSQGNRNYTLIFLMVSTGLRVSEALGLKWEQVNFDEYRIIVNGKGDKQRYAVMSNSVYSLLRDFKTKENRLESDYIFHCYAGVNSTNTAPEHRVYLQSPFDDALKILGKKSGLSKLVSGKMFRHTFATDLYEAGVEYGDIQELLGHERRMESCIYVHVSTKKMREQLSKKEKSQSFTGFIHE